ncbi:MAG: cytochrome C oxidase subunit IV [Dehalococcoidia bacterium]|nr:cytochrome C oxidase subunit IV [Dehalococcoidia bacterium]
MAQHTQTTQAHRREPVHPTPITYAKVAAALGLITVAEIGLLYINALNDIVIPVFFILSVVKFALVVMFYMHLRYDSRLFSGFFVGALLLAASIVLGLIALFKTIFV